jgi:hypothetical protein
MPISEKQFTWLGNQPYYEVSCSKCGWKTKAMGGGKNYAKSVLAQHNRDKH